MHEEGGNYNILTTQKCPHHGCVYVRERTCFGQGTPIEILRNRKIERRPDKNFSNHFERINGAVLLIKMI